MAFLHSTWQLFAANARTAILFELAFRALFAALFVPLCFGMADLAIGVAGMTYLADTNLTAFLASPTTWVLLVAAVLLLSLCALFEMSALVIIMQAGKERRRIGVFETFRRAFASARSIALPSNWLLIPFVLLLVPLTNLAVTSSALTGLRFPEFILDFIWENNTLAALFVAVMAALYVHAFFLAFGIHFFTLLKEPWIKARRSSKHLLRGNSWRLLRRIIALALIFTLGALSAAIVGASAFAIVEQADFPVAISVVLALVAFSFAVATSCIFTPLGYAALSCTFYELMERRGAAAPRHFDASLTIAPAGAKPAHTASEQPDPTIDTTNARRKRAVDIAIGLGLAMLGCAALFAYSQAHGLFDPPLDPPATFAVTAHRGGSREAPENTLAAFQKAIDEGADWVELDVQQTSDGVLMVMHDANLKRTTGLDKEFWQVTYDEIKDLDNGSWFDAAFASQRVCTLEEALVLCKGKIKMNIEVKPDGHGIDLEKKTVDLINAHNMADQVAVASISYDALVRVKQADPAMPTMFDMTIAYGRITDIDCVDYFSVDDFFVTQELVDEVRSKGKIVYAWTVNDPANMSRLIAYGIDGLVTDDVRGAQERYANEGYDLDAT